MQIKNTCLVRPPDWIWDYGVFLFVRQEVTRSRSSPRWHEDVVELCADSQDELDRKIVEYVERPGVTLTDDAWMPYELEAP